MKFNRELLKQVRKHRKISLRDMESPCGLSNAYLSQLETGQVKNPSLLAVCQIARFFDLPIEVFVDRTEVEQENPNFVPMVQVSDEDLEVNRNIKFPPATFNKDTRYC